MPIKGFKKLLICDKLENKVCRKMRIAISIDFVGKAPDKTENPKNLFYGYLFAQ